MNKTAVVTISSRVPHEPYYHLKEFTASAQRKGINPIWLPSQDWKGLMTKPRRLLDWIEKEGANFDYIVSVDAWDILWFGDLEELTRKFSSFQWPIVFNAERSCFPRPDLAEKFDTGPYLCSSKLPSPYRFLNSGFFIGNTESVRQMLLGMKLETLPDDILPDGRVVNTNDQEHYQLFYLEHQDKIGLDWEASLCQSLHESAPDEFSFDPEIKRVRSTLTGSYPVCVHGNGSGKAWLKKMIGWMGL